MNFLDNQAAPIRENRLGVGVAFGGTCREARCAASQGCLNQARRSFNQTHGCEFTLSLAITSTFRNAVIVMHGPIGCGSCVIASAGGAKGYRRLRDPAAEGLIWLSTNLGENDVVGGGEDKLARAILHADRRFRPEIIVVPVSCVPALVGDDVDTLLHGLQAEVGATLVPVHCPGFRSKVMATAYDDVYHGLLKTLVRKNDDQSNEKILNDELQEMRRRYIASRTVNVLNVSSMARADELELERLLRVLDLRARFLPCYSGSLEFRESLESALNVSVCGTHDDYFLEHLKSLFDIPFMIDTIPIGPRNTGRWLMGVADRFGLSDRARRLIDAEEASLEEAIVPYREFFQGKKAFLSGGEVRIVATAELLRYLGLEIVGFKGHHFDHFTEPAFEELPGLEGTVFLVATQQPFEQVNLIQRLKPDVFVGHTGSNNISARQGLPILPLFGNSHAYMGYAGVFEVARNLRRVMLNGRFNRLLAEHCPLPYRKSWYEKDPFSYIKDY